MNKHTRTLLRKVNKLSYTLHTWTRYVTDWCFLNTAVQVCCSEAELRKYLRDRLQELQEEIADRRARGTLPEGL